MMRKIIINSSLILLLAQWGCGQSEPAERIAVQAVASRKDQFTTTSSSSPKQYTWATVKSGPGCMPQVRAIMDWYTSQADDLHQVEFTPGVPTDGPITQGPYRVNMDAIEYYLSTL